MSWTVVVCSAVLGAAVGVLLPRAVYRLSVPWGTPSRAGCAHCGVPFPPGGAGWIRVGAACSCRPRPTAPWATAPWAPAPWATAPWATTSATAVSAGVLGAVFPVPAVAVPLASLGVLLAAIDLGCLRLPDPLVGAFAVIVVVPLVAAGEPRSLGRAVLAAGLVAAAYLVVLILPGAGLGFGDVKLAAVLGFALGFLGWPVVLAGLLAPHLINGPIALFLLLSGRARRRTALPLGPALLAGALIAAALQI